MYLQNNMAKKKRNNELVLKVKKEEFFNPLVLAPHSEINECIYAAVDNYSVHLKRSEDFNVVIFTSKTPKSIQEKFKELFHEHYVDECYKKRVRFRQLCKKTAILVGIALIVLLIWVSFKNSVFRELWSTLWAFNVWEASHTAIEAFEVFKQYDKISHIKNANIEFTEY